MISNRRQRLDEAVVAALERPRAERESEINRLCGADEDLRTEALSLLAAVEASEGFLAGSALDRLAKEMAADGWRLHPGERVGPYVVQHLLGSGGSGEVWRARDERLQRDVALKVLLPQVSDDPERLRRFANEARSAGALNHPNILSVYDVGEHRGAAFLVTECVEGRSLRSRLDAGPLSVAETLAIAMQIVRGLAAAHARGIVHLDLKPENVRLRTDRLVKIVDFGLAKLQLPAAAGTEAAPRTLTGVIAGTPGYMAPEQVRGEAADGRADLFALGVTLYEMLGGRRPFAGNSTIEILHGILAADPPDITEVVPDVPAAVGAIVMRLLQKEPEARFQSATDLAWALEQVMQRTVSGASRAADAMRSPRRWRRSPWTAAAAAISLATLAVVTLWPPTGGEADRPSTPLTLIPFALPSGLMLDSAPVPSPDGRWLAFAAIDDHGRGRRHLWLKDRGALHAVVVPGTDGAAQPFWKPDSQWMGFFARGMLMKVAIDGGAPVELAPAADPRGGAWGASGTIVYAPDLIGAGLARVNENGGAVDAATLLDPDRGENSHRWPVFLPDGRHVLYFNRASHDEWRGVYLARIDRAATTSGTLLFRSESEAVYAPPLKPDNPGDLLSVDDGGIQVRPFDSARLVLAGNPRRIDFAVGAATPYYPSMLGTAADVLAFVPTAIPFGSRLGRVDLTGGEVHLHADREVQNWPRLSPNGRLLARARIDPVRGKPDIWAEDVTHGRAVRVTESWEPQIMPVWSPDSSRIAYVTGALPGRPGAPRILIVAADGSGVIRELQCPEHEYCEPTDWTPDAYDLIVTVRLGSGSEVWKVPAGGAAPERLVVDRSDERDARVSPNGQWIAFVSGDHGRPEVFVRPLRNVPGAEWRTPISSTGGSQPVWRRDGSELYFVDPRGRLRVVPVSAGSTGRPVFGPERELPVPAIGTGHWGTQYDVSKDGRLYFIDRDQKRPTDPITVVLGWRATLDARITVQDRSPLRVLLR